jgi:hypothetical protein
VLARTSTHRTRKAGKTLTVEVPRPCCSGARPSSPAAPTGAVTYLHEQATPFVAPLAHKLGDGSVNIMA